MFLLFHFYFFLVIKECSHTLMCTSFGFYFFSPHTLLLTLFQYLFRVYKYHHHHHMQRHGRHDDDRTRINTVLNVVCAREGQASNFRKKITHTQTRIRRTDIWFSFWEWEEIQHGIFRRMRIGPELTYRHHMRSVIFERVQKWNFPLPKKKNKRET